MAFSPLHDRTSTPALLLVAAFLGLFILPASALSEATDDGTLRVDPWNVDASVPALPTGLEGATVPFAARVTSPETPEGWMELPAVAGGYLDADAAYRTSCALDANGAAFCWGRGEAGHFGDGTYDLYSSTPRAVTTGVRFTQIEVTGQHVCALSTAGQVWCWGDNFGGQLGDGTNVQRAIPGLIADTRGFQEIAAGGSFTCALDQAGAVLCWGDNAAGQLGDGTNTNRNVPTPVAGGPFTEIYTGDSHACGLTPAGQVYCWGANWGGQLGNGGGAASNVPVLVGGGMSFASLSHSDGAAEHTCALDASGQAWCWGTDWWGKVGGAGDQSTPFQVASGHVFDRVFAFGERSCGTKNAANETWCWGRGDTGARGDGTLDSGGTPTLVATGQALTTLGGGFQHSCAVGADGTGYCFGADIWGELGQSATLGTASAVQVSGLTGVTAVDMNDQRACAIADPGATVYCWGQNIPLGDGSLDQSLTPVATSLTGATQVSVGDGFVCAVAGAAQLYCWGWEWTPAGQFFGGNQLTPGLVWSGVSQVDTGAGGACFVAGGIGFCWGANWAGQIGDGSFTQRNVPTEVSGSHSWRSISWGDWLTCGVTTADVAYCWGANWWGGLGIGVDDGQLYNTPQVVSGGVSFEMVETGYEATACGIDTAGAAHCWGRGDRGQRGDGTTNSAPAPSPVAGSLTFSDIDVGRYQVCAETTGGNAFCWGDSGFGQAGGAVGDLVLTPTGQGFSSQDVGLGRWASCFVDALGRALCKGQFGIGALGDGTALRFPSPQMLPAVTSDPVYALGDSIAADIAGTETDSYFFNLSVGDTVDLGAFAASGTGLNPRIELYDPAGNFHVGYDRTRILPDSAGIITSHPIDETGAWRVDVRSPNSTTGAYTVRSRSAGPVIATEPFRGMLVAAPFGGTGPALPLDVYNFGIGSSPYSLSTSESWLGVSPTGGTLIRNPQLGAAAAPPLVGMEGGDGRPGPGEPFPSHRPDATTHDVTFTAGALTEGQHYAELTATPNDAWGLPHVIPVNAHVYDPSVELIGAVSQAVNWAVFEDEDGTVLVGDISSVRRIDPATGTEVERWDVVGAGFGFFVSGIRRIGSRLFASVNNGTESGYSIVELQDGGGVVEFANFAAPVRALLAIGNVLYASVGSGPGRLVRVERSGTQTDLGSHPSVTNRAWALAFDRKNNRILFPDMGSGAIYTYDVFNGGWDTDPLVNVGGEIRALDIADSGTLYAGGYGLGSGAPFLHTIDPVTGAVTDLKSMPDWVLGVQLGAGEAWIASSRWGLVRTPVPDSAQSDPVLALGDSVTVDLVTRGDIREVVLNLAANDTVDIGVFLDNRDRSAGERYRLDLYAPDGSLVEGLPYSLRWGCNDGGGCSTRAATVVPAFVPAQTGSYRLSVRNDDTSVKRVHASVRRWGAVLFTAQTSVGTNRGLDFVAPQGGSPVLDTLFLYNTGPASAGWTGSNGGQSAFTLSPSSGTLPAGVASAAPGLVPAAPLSVPVAQLIPGSEPQPSVTPPADAVPVEVAFDPSGFSQGDNGRADGFSNPPLSFTPTGDGWALAQQNTATYRVFDPAFTLEARLSVGSRAAQSDVGPDGDVYTLSNDGVIWRTDPVTGSATQFATGVGGPAVFGLKVADDGRVYVVDQDGPVYEVSTSGVATEIHNPGVTTYTAIPLPDGRVFVSHFDGFDVVDGGTGSRLASEASIKISVYNANDGWVYFWNFSGLSRVNPNTGVIEPVGAAPPGGMLAFDIGRSGNFYVAASDSLRVLDSALNPVTSYFHPGASFGMALGEGVLYGSTRFDPGWVYSLPVSDGPSSPVKALALGDTARFMLDTPGGEKLFSLDLTAGDTIDLAALNVSTTSPMYPQVEVLDGNGGLVAAGSSRRFWCDGDGCNAFMGRALPAWVVPSTGTYTLRVYDVRSNTGEMVLRTRSVGDIVLEGRGADLRLVIPTTPGTTATDSAWIRNSGPGSAAWSGASSSLLTLSPSSGTLPAGTASEEPEGESGAGPGVDEDIVLSGPDGSAGPLASSGAQLLSSDAVVVQVTADATSLPMDTVLVDSTVPDGFGISFSLSDDFGYDASQGVELRVYDPSHTLIATDFPSRIWGVAERGDGTLVVNADGGLWSVNPADGSRTPLVTGLSAWWGLSGIDVAPSGDVYVGDVSGDRLIRVRPDLSQVALMQGENVYDVSVAPNGDVWVAATNALWRIPAGGTPVSVTSGSNIRAVQHDLTTGTVLFSDGSVIKRYDPAGPSVSTVGDLGFFNYAIDVAASGELYLRSFWEVHRMDPSTGNILWEKLTPVGGTGMYLADGKVYSTGMRSQMKNAGRDWIASYPVADTRAQPSGALVAASTVGGVVAQGDTLDAGIFIDMSNSGGKALGGFSARVVWDTTVVRVTAAVNGDFSGTANINTDSLGIGVLRLGGLNTNDGANLGKVQVGALKVVGVGAWGSETTLRFDSLDVSATDFSNLTSDTQVTEGTVLVSPGTLTLAVRGEASVSADASQPIHLRGYLADLSASIGALGSKIELDPAVVAVDSITAGNYGGTLDSNRSMLADSGFVRVAAINTSPPAGDSVTFATLWVRGVGAGGDSTAVTWVLEELSDAVAFTDLKPFVTGNESLTLTVASGIWGDPNEDEAITALDALICLSAVVGKDVSQFDAAACDVAPDSGASFTGAVTALDALAILSAVVGKALPPTFRVGASR